MIRRKKKDRKERELERVGNKIQAKDEEDIPSFVPLAEGEEASDETSSESKKVEKPDAIGVEEKTDPDEHDYIDQVLKTNWDVLHDAERSLQNINRDIAYAKEKIDIFEAIKKEDFRFDLKWLINRIEALIKAETKDPLPILEKEILGMVKTALKEKIRE